MSYNNNSNSSNNASGNNTPALGSWRSGHDHSYETSQRHLPVFPQSPPRSSQNSQLWGSLGHSLSRFPAQPVHYSPMRILVLNSAMAREANPWQRPMIRESPPGYFGQQSFSIPTYEEETETRLSQGGQNSALKMLKKEIYNSPPKSITRRLSSFYKERDQGKSLSERTIEQDDDENGKRCAVCLDDFEPKQEVMVTPCKHVFHEDCIVPWMKSNNQCPVCRFTIGEPGRTRQRATPVNNINIAEDMAANSLFSGELISVIRAMEEAFQWGSVVP